MTMTIMRELWPLANGVIRASRQWIIESLAPLGLGSAEGNILYHLLVADGIVRQENIVEQLELSKPAISRALQSLESKGYVTREKDPNDKRVHWIILTPQACEASDLIQKVYESLVEVAQQGITEAEAEAFVAMFRKVSANLAQRGNI